MKKRLVLSLIICLALVLVACGSNDQQGQDSSGQEVESSGNKLEEIKDQGKLILGVDAQYAPFMFHKTIDGEDVITGYEVEIMKLYAEELGVELLIQDVDFSQILPGVETGMYDIGTGGLNPTPERLEVLDFTDIYFEGEFTIMVQKGQEGFYNSMDDLEGKTVGVQTASVQETMMQENFDNELVSLPLVPDLIVQLQAGMIDCLVLEVPVAQNYASQNENIVAVEAIDFAGVEVESGVAAAVQKGQADLLESLNDFIERKKEDGTLDRLYVEAVELSQDL